MTRRTYDITLISRVVVFAAAMAPLAVIPLSGARLASPGSTLGWATLCALSLALAPGYFGRLAALVPLATLPLIWFWIGVTALTGTGPPSNATEIALAVGSKEVLTSIRLAMHSSAFLASASLTTAMAWLAWRMNKEITPAGGARRIAFLLSLIPFTVVVAEGHTPPFGQLATLCSPEARRSVPMISLFGIARSGIGITASNLIFGTTTLQRTTRKATDAPKTFQALPGLVVLILGDSMRPDALIDRQRGAWSAMLDDRIRAGLGARLPDACASGNGTFVSIPLLMTNSSPQAVAATHGKPSLLALAKAAGASTSYISNHEDFLLPESGHDDYVSTATLGVPALDEVAVTALGEFAARTKSPARAAWVHLYGQHLPYDERYPWDLFAVPPKNLSADELEHLHYMRAAEYGAKVLLQAAAILDRESDPAVLIFTSDHGENLWADGNRKRYHAGPVSGRHDTMVPVLALWNEAFRRSKRPAMLEPLLQARAVIAHRDVATAWLALAGSPYPPAPTKDPSTWGALDDGKGLRALRCADLPP